MAIATYMGDARLSNKDFENLFYTLWEARLDEARPLVRERDLGNTDRLRYGESVMGVVVAPKSNENGQTQYFAPNPGKDVYITTDIYKLGMKATQELREFGRGGDYTQFPSHMVNVLDYTVKTQIFNVFNTAFDPNVPTKYDGQALCSLNHPLAGGGVASNTFQTPADLNEQSFEAACEGMLRTPTEDGVITMQWRPTRLVTSSAKWGDNIRHTRSSFTVTTANNRGPNVPNVVGGLGIEPYFHPMLVSADDWFVMAQESPILLAWTRKPVIYGGQLDIEQNVSWIAKMQHAVVNDTWRGIWGSIGS
jgi:hypothetical protein